MFEGRAIAREEVLPGLIAAERACVGEGQLRQLKRDVELLHLRVRGADFGGKSEVVFCADGDEDRCEFRFGEAYSVALCGAIEIVEKCSGDL
jgi:hypothetical protein